MKTAISTKSKSSAPVKITDVKRGQVAPSETTKRFLNSKLDNDPRWREG